MKRLFIICALIAIPALRMMAEVDPNFYIYICFGQSNMEGNAKPEDIDKKGIDKRFRLLATCNNSDLGRTTGNWYKATPPLVSPAGGLGPTDYFGRTMCEALPENVRIGVIPVAMGGSPIEMFDKDKYQQQLKDHPSDWWAILANNHYGGNPYGRIIEMAKKAQEVGVIKGILLHQGCSNCGNPDWPNMVKKIYNDMLTDLNLGADSVPLFVGEVEYKGAGTNAESGGCAGHNVQVARIPSVIPTGHVISAEGCPGNNSDPWHFSAFGYRMLGSRYAGEALYTLGQHVKYCSLHDYDITLNKYATYDGTTHTLTATESGNGLANWVYPHFADWSGSKYLVIKLKEAADPMVGLRLYGKNKTLEYRDTLNDRTTMVVDLHNLKYSSKIMDPSMIYKMVLFVPKNTKVVLDDIFLSDDEAYGELLSVKNVEKEKVSSCAPIYSLDGRRANREALKPGLYVKKGKKMLVR
jgi:hypothetical protein